MRGTRVLLWIVVVLALAGCATRSSRSVDRTSPAALGEAPLASLIAEWQARLCRRIAASGGDAGAALSELRGLRARTVLRPARVQFNVLDLDVEGERRRWDVQGVLVGLDRRGVFVRYVFMFGVIGHADSLSSELHDLRVVSLAPLGNMLAWETSAADANAVRRYRDSFGEAGTLRFAADDDDFTMRATRDRLAVREMRSGAEWSLALRADLRDTRGLRLSRLGRGVDASASCTPL